MNCETCCRVRHCGPTSHVRDHHAHVAARGVHHTWMAAIVTGAAIVLTGALAFQGVEAGSSEVRTGDAQLVQEVRRLINRVEDVENELRRLGDTMSSTGAVDREREL